MQNDLQAPYHLNVPITDDERAHSRDGSKELLLRPPSSDNRTVREDSEESLPQPVHYWNQQSSGPPSTAQNRPYHRPTDSDASYGETQQSNHPDQPGTHFPKLRSGYAPVQRVPDLWRPLWLRKPVLGSFAILFAGLLATLIVLRYHANDDHGFGVAKSTSHYTWTYLPTTVVVILVGLWRPVDYYCKTLVPWAELRKGPVQASKSVLLDYVSPFQIFSCIKAFQRGHWAVVTSILAFLLLKFMVSLFPTTQRISANTASRLFFRLAFSCFYQQILRIPIFPLLRPQNLIHHFLMPQHLQAVPCMHIIADYKAYPSTLA